eukprot:12391962-Prorocentrum_lima.AAC.1
MTSSLVGSEMCIRDSECGALLLHPHGASDIPPDTPRSFNQWSGLSTAVSYTHLTLPTICSV